MNEFQFRPTSPAATDGLIVGIIDDNASFRTAMSRVLERAGFVVRAFSDPREFVQSGSMRRIHCLLLDVKMPGIDGFALLDGLRATNYRIPVILCSGDSSKRTQVCALTSGAVAFLRKPIDSQDLIQAVYRACDVSSTAVHKPGESLAG